MPSDKLDMIKSLVYCYSTGPNKPQPWTANFVEGRADEKLFLLRDSPGVGKTDVTIDPERIAEFTGRPLLSLICGDLGNNEMAVEKALSKWFALVERGGVVMLLSEADVYITQKRTICSVKRSSMASVFLRCMEYYKGILFLTTNCVSTFDDLVITTSLQVVICYKHLGEIERKKIWEQLFKKLSTERGDMYVCGGAKKYTAVALADYESAQMEDKSGEDDPTLKESHFEKVCNMTLQFKEYLNSVNDGLSLADLY
ncbi:P-loop containing nucleoside triphosphate hydrolase protein [Xylariaceae sp. AK1471]|nr:P-loop containing nucleoside triphosphate hydrolase protein [Xylariaceae sp. AK1471]